MRRTVRALVAVTLVAATLSAALPPAGVAAQGSAAAGKALAWIRAQQQADGSFPGFGPGDSADAVIALAAAGEDPATVTKGGKSALDYLEGQAATYAATGPGAAAKLVMAAVAAGMDPTSFGGENLLAVIGKSYDAQTGQYGPDVFGHALAMLAVNAVGATPPAGAIARLIELQLDDGGWSFDGTAATGSDTNTTSLALQALAGQRQADGARASALAYLRGQQNDDGGFPYSQTSQFGNASDANSTAAVAQAIVAAGQSPTGRAWTKGGKTPLIALAALQNPGGALRYQADQPDDNALATYQALPALLSKALPVATASVSGAGALIAPAPTGAPTSLPATGAPAGQPGVWLLLALGLALAAAGLRVRRATR